MNNFNKFLENHLAKVEKSSKKEKNDHAILDKEPHFIFSVENPLFPEKQSKQMDHNEMVQKLNKLGYKAQGIHGQYGGEEERSILVHNPSKKQTEQLHRLAAAHGQESGIYSDGVNHELHFYHGDNSDFYNKGKGTVLFDNKPDDHFSHLGTSDKGGDKFFRHNVDFESFFQKGTHKPREQVEAEQQASEEQQKAAKKQSSMSKAEDDHLKDSLVHYSSEAGLKSIDPSFQGKGADARTKGRSLDNKVSFFYRHGTEPESVVTQGAKSKYVTKLNDDHKLYDMGKDPESHISNFSKEVKAHNEKNPQNQKYHNTDTMYENLKEKGYHGIFNSTHDSLSNVVAMFGAMDVHSELPAKANEKVASASLKDVTMADGKSRLDVIRQMTKRRSNEETEYEDEEDNTEELNFTNRRMFKAEDDSSGQGNIKINPEHGKKIADEYEKMKHDPNNPEVKKAYGALINETKSQFNDIMKSGIKISRIEEGQDNPYKNSKELHHDIKNNNHMHFYPTASGFGDKDDIKKSDHPMLQGTGIMHGGKELLANDIFRIVHDINGHHAGGESGFGAKGEHQAYNTHKQTYSSLAAKALATETLGQNSWVNFGPHGDHNRANPAQTKYADQKAALLPDHILNENWHSDKSK